MLNKYLFKIITILFIIYCLPCFLAGRHFFLCEYAFAQNNPEPVIVDGDKVEVISGENKVEAEGNISIIYRGSKLTCDKIVVDTLTKDALASGNVRIESKKAVILADKAKYNLDTQKGLLYNARILSSPFYARAEFVEKISDKEIKMYKGYFTTCDRERPHYRFKGKSIDFILGEKIHARDLSFMLFNSTLAYIPQYTHPLNDNRPRVTVTPGLSKDWGLYVLSAWRYYINEDFRGRIHLDYRERKDFASGFDTKYNTNLFGEGFLRTYYMNERSVENFKHPWKESLVENFKEELLKKPVDEEGRQTVEKERFRISLRHNWDIDKDTTFKVEYNRFSDAEMLQDYFLREHDMNASTSSYALFTHLMPFASFSILTQKRTNRFNSIVEKLPEVKLDISNTEIGESNIYYSGVTSAANLNYKTASPSDAADHTNRIDTYNKISYPKKIAFIEVSPFAAGRFTYYDRDIDSGSANTYRGVFETGIDMSTKFYRIFDIETNFLRLDLHKLRHIITPSIKYSYRHDPTVASSKFFSFDGIDSIAKSNGMTLGLENKLQTKRGGKSVDLVRFTMDTDYTFHPEPQYSAFGNINFDLEVVPYKWVRFEADSTYDREDKAFKTANFDLVLRGAKEENNYDEDGYKFFFGAGYRYQRNDNNQITTQLTYRLNPDWKFRFYERWERETGGLREQEYTIYKDLHCWQVGINYKVRRDYGEEIFLVFKIKAFPDSGVEFNTSYHAPKEGELSY